MERVQDGKEKTTTNIWDRMVNLEEVFGSRGDVPKSLGNAPGFILFWDVAERVEVWYNRVGNDQNGATDCAANPTEENGET